MNKKRILLVAFFLLAIIVLGYLYIYQDHRDISNETPYYTLTADEFGNEFVRDFEIAEQKYLNKTIMISGIITDFNENSITMDDMVFCQFEKNLITNIKIDSKLKIKGRFIGYDDLLEQIKLDQCSIKN